MMPRRQLILESIRYEYHRKIFVSKCVFEYSQPNQLHGEFQNLQIPAIVYFEKEIPNVYDGDLMDEEQILKWLLGQLEHDEIEDVTDEMLDTMIKEGRVIAVLFCKYV